MPQKNHFWFHKEPFSQGTLKNHSFLPFYNLKNLLSHQITVCENRKVLLMLKVALWHHLDKKVLLWHREAPVFIRAIIYLWLWKHWCVCAPVELTGKNPPLPKIYPTSALFSKFKLVPKLANVNIKNIVSFHLCLRYWEIKHRMCCISNPLKMVREDRSTWMFSYQFLIMLPQQFCQQWFTTN